MNKPETTIEYIGKTYKFVGLSSEKLVPRRGDVVKFQTPLDKLPDAPNVIGEAGLNWNPDGLRLGHYQIFRLVKRNHRNTPRKTARERTVYVINRGAMAEDIEKQIQLAVKAYAKRKANR